MQLLSRLALAFSLVALAASQPSLVDAQIGSPVMKKSPHKPHAGPKPPAWSPPSKPPKRTHHPDATTTAPPTPTPTTASVSTAAALPEAQQQRWRGLRLSN